MTQKKKLIGALLSIGSGICWGLSGSMGQYLFSEQGMDSRWLVPIRLGFAGILLILYSIFRYGTLTFSPWKNKKEAALTLVYGIPGVAFSQFLYFLCIQLSSAGMGTILQNLSPVLVLTLTCLLTRRSPRLLEILSILFALLGVFTLVTHWQPGSMAVSWGAILAGIGSACGISIYTMLGRPLLAKYPVFIIQGWSFLLGGIVMALLFQSWRIDYRPNFMGYLGIAFVIVMGNVLAFTCYMTGIRLIGPLPAGLYAFSEPVTAALVTFLFLGSPFTAWDALGFFLILLMMVSISRRREAA